MVFMVARSVLLSYVISNHSFSWLDYLQMVIQVRTMKRLALFLLLLSASLASATTYTAASVNYSDVAPLLTMSKLADGDTVIIPPGSATWTSGVTVNKAITIQGAGAGRIIGYSGTTSTIATGSLTLTVTPTFGSSLNVTTGQILTVAQLGDRRNYMQGVVTSYSGTTLVLDITTTGGAGSHHGWLIATQPLTTITHAVASSSSITLNESTNGNVTLSGIHLVYGSGNLIPVLDIVVATNGRPVLIHDCWFQLSSNEIMVRSNSHRGVMWNCSFDAQWAGAGQGCLGIQFSNPADSTGSWTSNATMGSADTVGANNFYVEDCDFHAFLNAIDFTDASRSVVRYSLFNTAGLGSHGPDSARYGNRHFEVYNNTFVFNGFSDGTTLNLNWWLFLRGGTGVWTNNVMPAINSMDYPNQPTYRFTVMALRRQAQMQAQNACWSGGYPLPREIGQGYVDGSPALEPVYIWGNAGTANQTPTLVDVSCSDPTACSNCSTQPLTSDFLVSGRDYYVGTPKPGYVKYTYPHPLRATMGPLPPKNLRING
jgi:hypothetical protein